MVTRWLEARRGLCTATAPQSVHILFNEADSGLQTLEVLRGAVPAAAKPTLDDEADSALLALQFHLVGGLKSAHSLPWPRARSDVFSQFL